MEESRMTTVVVLFNLRPGADPMAYEQWARSVDIPNVRRLQGCGGFEVLKVQGLFSGQPGAPYQYVELIHIDDMAAFRSAVSAPAMQAVAAQFREYADQPCFMLTESL
jgi:uncharacterized protein (TIGR02118 family)